MSDITEESLVARLRKRAAIRRQISTRKSVQEGKPDRLADLLEEAADEITFLEEMLSHCLLKGADELRRRGVIKG